MDVHGIFRQLYAPGFPAQQDRLVLAIDVEWDEGETGRREFRIDLMDPGASPVFTINGHTDVNAVTDGEPPPLTRLIMPLDDVPFPEAGTYLFEFESGDRRIPLAPIHLIENPDAV